MKSPLDEAILARPFDVYLAVAIAAYLALVEATKRVFYRYYDARQ